MLCCFSSLLYYLIYALIAVFVMVLSALVISEQFRKAFFARIFTSQYAEWVKSLFVEHRSIWLKEFSELKPQNSNKKLNVLEVGVGAGSNFQQFPDNCQLTVLDYNDNFKDEFMKNIKKHPNIEFEKYLTGNIEDMHQIDDNSFDVVLITHVLCSVGDVLKGLKEVNRVLKKDGKFFFFEHVGYHKSSMVNNFWSLVQCVMNPVWTVVMCNCILNKQNWLLIQKAGFRTTEINHSYPDNVPGHLRPHIWGCAIK